MYHVDVKKNKTKVISSVLPDSSNLSGEVLRMRPLLVRELQRADMDTTHWTEK